MIIAHVCPYFYPHIGGVESYVQSLCRALAAMGHEVHVITSKLEGERYKPYETMEGFHVHRIRSLRLLYSTPINIGLGKKIAEISPHILHAHTPPPFSAYRAVRECRRQRIPSIITYHCDLEPPSPTLLGKAVIGLYRRVYGKKLLSLADKIVLTTKSYAATSADAWRHSAEIVPNAVDTHKFRPDIATSIREKLQIHDKPVILFVGRLVRHKGVDYLIKSAKLVKSAYYLIVGDGPMRVALEKLAAAEKVQDRILFAGYVPDDVLPQYYAACDVFVLPSISRLEAFGIVVLEAMACGKPVIISNIPGVRDVIDEGSGMFAEPMDEVDLARKIEFLLQDAELRKKMGENARRRVLKNFEWSQVARKIEKIYKDVILNYPE